MINNVGTYARTTFCVIMQAVRVKVARTSFGEVQKVLKVLGDAVSAAQKWAPYGRCPRCLWTVSRPFHSVFVGTPRALRARLPCGRLPSNSPS